MKMIMWGILLASTLGLLFFLLKMRGKVGRALSRFAIQIIFGTFVLIGLNLFSSYTQLTLPINIVTIATVGLLGLPGLILLGALKMTLVV